MSKETWEEEIRRMEDAGGIAFAIVKWLLQQCKPGKKLSREGERFVRNLIWHYSADLTVLYTTEEMWEP